MKISKKDALTWYRFFAELPEDEALMPHQQELAWAVIGQIEAAVDAHHRMLMAEIPDLHTLCGRTYFVGDPAKFSRGCTSCLTGTGLTAIRRTNRCNIQCPFCYNYGELDCQEPIGEGLWEIGGTYFRAEDIELLLSTSNRPTGVSYVYLEPFMEIDLYPEIIRKFRAAGIHQHMYTNGTLCTEENLRMLGDAGLDELRFNLGATSCSDKVIRNITLAKKYIPTVAVETPMTPDFYEHFQQKKDEILATGIDFINCAELHLNPNNLGNYIGAPMYMTRRGYVSPIFSREITFKLMRQASEEHWGIVVHDCSNHTKFARDLNLRAKEGAWFGASSYHSEFDQIPFAAFLPTLEDESFHFLEEEPLPRGYRPGDIVL